MLLTVICEPHFLGQKIEKVRGKKIDQEKLGLSSARKRKKHVIFSTNKEGSRKKVNLIKEAISYIQTFVH